MPLLLDAGGLPAKTVGLLPEAVGSFELPDIPESCEIPRPTAVSVGETDTSVLPVAATAPTAPVPVQHDHQEEVSGTCTAGGSGSSGSSI